MLTKEIVGQQLWVRDNKSNNFYWSVLKIGHYGRHSCSFTRYLRSGRRYQRLWAPRRCNGHSSRLLDVKPAWCCQTPTRHRTMTKAVPESLRVELMDGLGWPGLNIPTARGAFNHLKQDLMKHSPLILHTTEIMLASFRWLWLFAVPWLSQAINVSCNGPNEWYQALH